MLKKTMLFAAVIAATLAVAVPSASARQESRSSSNAVVCSVLLQTDGGLKNVQDLVFDLAPLATGAPVALVVRRVRDALAGVRTPSCVR
jgi:hypothetical protein